MDTNFQPSVNVKLDQFNSDFIKNYIATPSHTNIIKKIIEAKLNDRAHSGAYLLVGPYGSGKSHLINIINSIVRDKNTSTIVEELSNVDLTIPRLVTDYQLSATKRETVILTGYEGRFDLAIKQKITEVMKKYGLKFSDTSLADDILSTIEQWKSFYEDTYQAFKNELASKGHNINDWEDKIRSQDIKSINDFKSIYQILTSGVSYQNDNRDSFFTDIKNMVSTLEENNINLTIFYDEFGRVLEESGASEVNILMQNIQDLAEISTRTKSLDLIFVSHKNINLYINKEYFPNLKNEFSKIEKRFDVNYIENDKLIFNRITKKTFEEANLKLKLNKSYFEKMERFIEKYPLFTELTSWKSSQLIVEENYPIHPITMFLLPRISNIFGQNERTLFTFLNYILNLFKEEIDEKEIIDPSYIYDYFFIDGINSLQEEEFNSLAIRTNLILESIEQEVDKTPLKKIIKLVFLWKASNSDNLFSLTNDLISNSLVLELEEVERLTKKLRDKNFIRYSYIDNSYEIVERSNIVFEEILREVTYKSNITKDNIISRLNNIDYDYKYIFPAKYNEEYSITRYYKTIFSLEKEEGENENFADGYINVIFNEDTTLEKKNCDSDNIEIRVNYDELLFNLGEKVLAIEKALDNRELLLEYEGLKVELEIAHIDKLQGIKNRIEYLLNKANPGFVFGQERHDIEIQYLGDTIDRKMYEDYPLTPVIVNDSINKNKVTSVQKKALLKVLDHVLKYPFEKSFNIDGNGPDYLIYCSLFKNHNFDLNDYSSMSSEYIEMRRALIEELEKSNEGNLSNLYNILISPPFGVREPLIPVLIVSLIRDYWDEIIISHNEMYVAALDAKRVDVIFNRVNEYTYSFVNQSPEFKKFSREIYNKYSKFTSDEVRNFAQPIRLSSALLNFYRTLPKWVQQSNLLKEDLQELKSDLRRLEISPYKTLIEMYEKYQSHTLLINKIEALATSMDLLIERITIEINKTAGTSDLNEIKYLLAQENKINQTIENLNEMNISNFAEKYIGVPVSSWSDDTLDLFIHTFKQEFNNLEYSNESSIIDIVNKYQEYELTTKGKTIYKNLDNILSNAGKNIPDEEKTAILLKLISKLS